jgi:hypothetical protein
MAKGYLHLTETPLYAKLDEASISLAKVYKHEPEDISPSYYSKIQAIYANIAVNQNIFAAKGGKEGARKTKKGP